MKALFIILLVSIHYFAQDTTAKIDMHGGGNNNLYNTKSHNGFTKKSFGMSNFLDKNTSK